MTKEQDLRQAAKAVSDFVNLFSEEFGHTDRKRNGKQYVTGLLLPGERKSIEPLSGRVAGSDVQSLQQFVNQSPWDHEEVLQKLACIMNTKLKVKEPILVLDDTPFRKKGRHSVGVAPQYCGTIGAVANCQSVVTLHAVAGKVHFPVAGQLYLPKEWTEDNARLQKAGVPREYCTFREKWRIALELLTKYEPYFKPKCLIFDAGYGEIRPFLSELDRRQIPFIGQVPSSHSFWSVDSLLDTTTKAMGRPRKFPAIADKSKKALTAEKWAKMPHTWTSVRLPSAGIVSCARVRVFEATSQAYYRPGPERWLLIVRCRDGTTKYFVSNMLENISLKSLITLAFNRWKIEQGYQQLKEELGLDHFEGRSWRGLHHHLAICFMTFAFLLLWRRSKKSLLSPCLLHDD